MTVVYLGGLKFLDNVDGLLVGANRTIVVSELKRRSWGYFYAFTYALGKHVTMSFDNKQDIVIFLIGALHGCAVHHHAGQTQPK
jgi:hypothetical protein